MKETEVIYLDNNATTMTAPEVLEEMQPFLGKYYGNPSSMHTFGGQVKKDLDRARARVAGLIGAEPEEVVFTSCGTESDNHALYSAMDTNPRKRHLITTRVEHPAVLNYAKHLSARGGRGYRVTFLPVDSFGGFDMGAFMDALDDDTAVVSVMYANNETGVIFPVREIGGVLRERGILFHTDAVQAVGKLPVDVRELPVDMLSISGHKLHAPKGVGALYVRKGTRFHPLIIGGHQEGGRRAGTENVASIVGLGKACELAAAHIADERGFVAGLRDRLEQGLLEKCPDASVNGGAGERLPNTTSIGFEYVEGEAILLRINEHGICASSGSACTSGSLEPSHVLRAMGVPSKAIHGSIRLSLSRYNTDADVDRVLDVMPGIVHGLRELSPFGREPR